VTFPSGRDWMFSARTFVAAMLALYVGLAFGLPRPYWAMSAVYIVSNPIAGAAVSKAIDRTLGTLLGATGAVVLIPLLVNAPELLSLAVALWTGTFLYIALHDKTPRGYVFLLAGYTLPLVGLPAVGVPGTIFDLAVARSEEIIVGIMAAGIVSTLVFPSSIGTALNARIARLLDDASAWTREMLLAKGAEPETPLARQRLAADIPPLSAMISQMGHDAGTRDVKRYAEELRGRLQFLLPILSSVADRLHALRLEMKAFPPALEAVTDQIAAWLQAPADPTRQHEPEQLRAALDELQASAVDASLWEALVRSNLITRLRELIDLWQDCLALQQQIQLGPKAVLWKPVLRHRPVIGKQQHLDRGLTLFSVGSTVLATFFGCLLWIWSGWSAGGSGVAFIAIACCFFGGVDRPAPLMRSMLIYNTVAYVLTGAYLFLVLPHVSDFEILVLTLAPLFLIVGAFIPRAELSLVTVLLATNMAGDLGLQGRYAVDFMSFVDGGLSLTAGLVFALVWTLVTRPFGVEIAARRLVRAGWSDLAALASGARSADHAALTSRTIDRLGQLMSRLASDATPALKSIDGLAELRVGYNIISLQRDRRALAEGARNPIDAVLGGVSAFFRRCADRGERNAAPDTLLHSIDSALRAVLHRGQGQARDNALDAMVGLRRALFPRAPGPADEGPGHASGNGRFAMQLAAE
jgi:uncharacterized membrane protein YccC